MGEQSRTGLTVAVLVVLTLVVIGVVQLLGGTPQAAPASGDAALLERIKPVGQLNTGAPITVAPPGSPTVVPTTESKPATPSATPTAAAPATPAKSTARSGDQVFSTTCFACHGTGAAGAPKLGDKAAWAPRIKQGNALLLQHATQGFTGKTGTMPPRGTCANCTDQELKSAVEYMVSKAK